MGDETGRPGEEGDPLHRVGGPAGIEHAGRDRARDVDRQRAVHDAGREPAERPQRRDVIARDAQCLGGRDEDVGARVAGAVLGMAEPRHLAPRRLQSLEALPAGAFEILPRRAARREHLDEIPPGDLRAAGDDAAHAEEAGRHGALPGLGSRRERHARRLHARDEAVLGDRDEAGVGHPALGLGGVLAGDEQPEVVGEADLADEVRAEVVAADGDRLRVRRGDGRERLILLADPHPSLSPSPMSPVDPSAPRGSGGRPIEIGSGTGATADESHVWSRPPHGGGPRRPPHRRGPGCVGARRPRRSRPCPARDCDPAAPRDDPPLRRVRAPPPHPDRPRHRPRRRSRPRLDPLPDPGSEEFSHCENNFSCRTNLRSARVLSRVFRRAARPDEPARRPSSGGP